MSLTLFLFFRDLHDIGCYVKVIDGCQQLDKETRWTVGVVRSSSKMVHNKLENETIENKLKAMAIALNNNAAPCM